MKLLKPFKGRQQDGKYKEKLSRFREEGKTSLIKIIEIKIKRNLKRKRAEKERAERHIMFADICEATKQNCDSQPESDPEADDNITLSELKDKHITISDLDDDIPLSEVRGNHTRKSNQTPIV